MAQGYEYGSGYQYGIPLPASEYGNRPAAEYVRGLSFSQSGSTVTITVTDQDDKATPYTFETGSDDAITGISITNENGVYTVKATTAGGTETEIGTIEVPTVNVDNLLAEINDEVVEDNSNGYDFHTLKETENNGTVNEVGKFYLAQKQVLSDTIRFNTTNTRGYSAITSVDQSGTVTTETGYHSFSSNAYFPVNTSPADHATIKITDDNGGTLYGVEVRLSIRTGTVISGQSIGATMSSPFILFFYIPAPPTTGTKVSRITNMIFLPAINGYALLTAIGDSSGASPSVTLSGWTAGNITNIGYVDLVYYS